jgi:hypothetical protein
MKDRLGIRDITQIGKDMKTQVAADLVQLLEKDGLDTKVIEYTATKLKTIDFVLGSLIGVLEQAEAKKELV